ncbi:MAG: V-type ATP synthase subunit F [Candidatus Aminicenantales bacterium]
MFDKVAIVGEEDLVLGFRALGMKVFSPRNLGEARQAFKRIEKEGFAVCFVHEVLLESLEMERKELSQKYCPVVVGYSDYRKITDYLERMMRKMAIKATGSDSLVKRRGEDETG